VFCGVEPERQLRGDSLQVTMRDSADILLGERQFSENDMDGYRLRLPEAMATSSKSASGGLLRDGEGKIDFMEKM
jgi:hypothetical protein